MEKILRTSEETVKLLCSFLAVNCTPLLSNRSGGERVGLVNPLSLCVHPRPLKGNPLALQRQCVAMPVTFHLCDAVHVINQLHIASPLLDITACKHALLRADHHFRR